MAISLFGSVSAVENFSLTTKASWVLEKYCYDCHDEDTQKGKIRLDNLNTLSLKARLNMLNRVQEQFYIKEMPPKKKKKQPSEVEREYMSGWLAVELKKHNASKLEDKLRYSDYGNYIDHEKLFSGKIKTKAFTPARRWIVSPQIFNERLKNVFKGEKTSRFYGVTNPFVLSEKSGVRYYDNMTIDGGHLLVMLSNAEWIASKQIRAARVKNGEFKSNYFPNVKDRWAPRTTPAAFQEIILKKTKPTTEEMTRAIQEQFDRVLGRQANSKELRKYLELIKWSIELGGNTVGLHQVMVAILLESEFLYRLEFGSGKADLYGRQMISPREGSFAISYAIGDRNPDAVLMAAAREGRLNTKEDYIREVTRLLNDKSYFAGDVDKVLNGKGMKSIASSHPRIIRFFREFFGYTHAAKVFKDLKRSGGYFRNPCRSNLQTPGYLILEADMLVDMYLKRDENVFEGLLAGEKFFVGPIADAAKKKDMLNKFHDHFKDTDWKKNPKKVAADHADFIKKMLGRGGEKNLRVAMTHTTKFRDKGLNPHPHWNYAFGRLLTTWVNSYSIDPFNWEYPIEQPFKIAHRKGMLTHPAWLIAHSQNAHTDPIVRGKWIREKLLAGRVPDVPITVDAQVPEDHDKTLRERFEMVTQESECWKCHEYMNPLGFPFEMFDDFGRYRELESLEHPDNIISKAKHKNGDNTYKTKSINTKGFLSGTGDPKLDGPVKDAIDLVTKLAKSKRVRQSIIRHAFRFYLGRNEMLSDSQTLIDADQAYVKNGGSFKAVIISLLTSDSFMYRKK